jgi:heavy metal translocating P-type ATPase
MPPSEGRRLALPAITAAAIAVGGLLHALGASAAGNAVWAVTIAAVLVPLGASVVRSLAHGDVGVDAIALVAMVGCLALGELLAGTVVALMLSGGNALEAMADRRARGELTALLSRAPGVAHRRNDGHIEEVDVADLAPGDLIVVRAGEIVPVDGVVAAGTAVLDEATLTGESLPVRRAAGAPVRSGAANAGDAFDLRATRAAAESAYAALVALVGDAAARRAPFVRMADRYAAFLLPVTLIVAGVAWVASGDPIRALAVLVVATPCPLILAAPIAFVSGVSRAARRGVIVKGAPAIEALGRARTVLLDKTGTLTLGTPEIETIEPLDGIAADDLLRLAASADQLSAHVMAEGLVHDAERRGMELSDPTDVIEHPGDGIEGTVGDHRVTVGSRGWLAERGIGAEAGAPLAAGRARVLVAVDGRPAGTIVMADVARPEAAAAITSLRHAGIDRVAVVTGDDRATAQEIAAGVGVEEVYADCRPEDKLALLQAIQRDPSSGPVVMVGDGVNDAPALAAADIGIAMAGAGATISTETADVVITVDRIDRFAEAVGIGRRSLAIARQSVLAGMALSFAAMIPAALGHLPPVAGALLQEGIDVAVILNALRALRPGRPEAAAPGAPSASGRGR